MVKRIPLGDLCHSRVATMPASQTGEIRYIDISSINNQSKRIENTQIIDAEEAPSRAKQLVRQFDILVSTVRPNLNAVAVVDIDDDTPLVASTGYCVLRCKNEAHSRYVYHFCQSPYFIEDMTKQATGASYPAVSAAIVRNSLVPLPAEDEIQRISRIFDNIARLIAGYETALDNLDLLVKSRFIEMFGLPGTDTFGWGLVPLGSVCHINPKKSQDSRLVGNLSVSFVPMPAVTEYGEIDATEMKNYDEVKTGFTYFAENDVLFAKITPCMENGKGAVARGLHNGIGFGSTEFHVLRPLKGVSDPRWIYTLTILPQFRDDAANNMTGSAGQRRVPASFLESYRVAVPPIDLQEQFAAFVTQTDKSKVEIQNALNELEILKKSLMQQYFG